MAFQFVQSESSYLLENIRTDMEASEYFSRLEHVSVSLRKEVQTNSPEIVKAIFISMKAFRYNFVLAVCLEFQHSNSLIHVLYSDASTRDGPALGRSFLLKPLPYGYLLP